MISTDLSRFVRGITPPHDSYFQYFDINGVLLRVASPNRGMLETLRSFFYPYVDIYEVETMTQSVHHLRVMIEPELYNYLRANLTEPPDHLQTTTLKHDFEYQLRYFCSRSKNLTIVEDPPLKLLYIASEQGVTIVAANESRIRTAILRIIRNAWIISHRGMIVHACALERHGHGIVIAGNKRAGKTTTLLNLSTRKNYNIVANDRLLLSRQESGKPLRVVGVPTVVNVRPETLKPFPDLKNLTTRPPFSVLDLADALNVDLKREVEVSAMVFLSYGRACPLTVRNLTTEETCKMLSAHLFSRRDYEWVQSLKIQRDPHPEIATIKQADLSAISCFAVTSNEAHLEKLADLLDEWCHRSGRSSELSAPRRPE